MAKKKQKKPWEQAKKKANTTTKQYANLPAVIEEKWVFLIFDAMKNIIFHKNNL